MTNQKSTSISRWKLSGLFMLAYISALLVALLPDLIRSGLGDGDTLQMVVCLFPIGLIYLVNPQGGLWALLVGFAIYPVLASVGVLFRSWRLLVVFIILLLANLGGCYKFMKDFEERGCHAEPNDSPTIASRLSPSADQILCSKVSLGRGDSA